VSTKNSYSSWYYTTSPRKGFARPLFLLSSKKKKGVYVVTRDISENNYLKGSCSGTADRYVLGVQGRYEKFAVRLYFA